MDLKNILKGIVLIWIFIIISVLFYNWFYEIKNHHIIDQQIKHTTKKIDSLKKNKETLNKAILDTFKRNTTKASTLIKSLPKEPAIILQADYKAMCDSILNYKPTTR